MIFKTIHKLVSHHAVRAKCLLAVVTVCHHVRVEILATFAHGRKFIWVDFNRAVYCEVRQQTRYSAVAENALLMTVGTRDLFWLILVVF